MSRGPIPLSGTGRRIAVCLGTAVLAAVTTACADDGETTPTTSRAPTTTTVTRPAVDGTLTIGELAPVTGPVSAIADSFTVPVQLAVDEMNLAGGVNGKPVTVSVADDASSIPAARAGLDQLVDAQHVDAIIGPSSSELAADLMPELRRRHVVMCSGSNSAGALSDIDAGGAYVRTAPPDALQADALAQLATAPGHDAPVVVAPADSYGDAIGPAIVRALRRVGANARLLRVTEDDEPAAVVTRALRTNPDALIVAGFPDLMAPLLRAFADAGKSPAVFPTYATDGLQTADLGALIDPANPAIVAGLSGTTPAGAPAGIDHPFTARLASAGVEPFFSASAYDCTILIGLAAVAAGSDDADEIRTRIPGLLRGTVDCTTFSDCAAVLRADRTIHYRGAFSRYDRWQGTEPGSGVYDAWTIGLDGRPTIGPATSQIAVVRSPA